MKNKQRKYRDWSTERVCWLRTSEYMRTYQKGEEGQRWLREMAEQDDDADVRDWARQQLEAP